MGIPLHHLERRPPSKLLQDVQRCSVLHVPACPSVPEVVPAKIAYFRPNQCFTPRTGTCLMDRSPRLGKDPAQGFVALRLVFFLQGFLGLQNFYCFVAQWYCKRFAVLGIFAKNPSCFSHQIYLRPFQMRHVGPSEIGIEPT